MTQCRIAEGAFHDGLAVVELAVDGHCADVAVEDGHELALAGADLGVGEQHDDADAGDIMKGVGHGGAGIAAGGGKNG